MNIASDLRKKWWTCESGFLLLRVFCAREGERGEGKEKLGRGNCGCGEDGRGAFRQLMAELRLEVMPLFTACNDNRNSATNHPHFVSSN